MAHRQSADQELVITKCKLEQATNQLAERDLEIAALKEEVSRLRQGAPPTDWTTAYPTLSDGLNDGKKINWDEPTGQMSPSHAYQCSQSPEYSQIFSNDNIDQDKQTTGALVHTYMHRAAEISSNEHCSSENQDSMFCNDSWADDYHYKSPRGYDVVPTTPMSWDNSWADNNNSSWDTEGSRSACEGPTGGLFQPGENIKENWRDSRLRPESKSWLHSLSFGRPAHTFSDFEYKDLMDLHVLPLATRLEDDGWLDSDLVNIRVDDERLFRLLTKGRELAQKCLWSFMDQNRPDIRRREFPGGWQQVKFEVSVLLDALEPGCLKFRQNSPRLARDSVFAVVPLRHLTSHWNHRDLGWTRPAPRIVDGHLKYVQKLAINLYDGECAAEARRLRDEARQAVEDTVGEMEALEPIFDVCSWDYHHEQMFEQIEYAKDMRTPGLFKYPDVFFRAADVWSRRRSSDHASEDDLALQDNSTEYQQPMKRCKKTYAQNGAEDAETLTEHVLKIRIHGRRHSISCGKTPQPSTIAEQQRRGRRNSSIFNL